MDNMEKWTDPLWRLIGVGVKEAKKDEPSLIYDTSQDAAKKFSGFFECHYEEIREKHMKTKNDYLDRHKVAAITIASIIHAGLIRNTVNNPTPNEVWVGLQYFALEIGLSYMLKRTNELLAEKGSPKQIITYHMPMSFSNDRAYIKTFSLLLYRMSPTEPEAILDLADRLFLVEYITLLYEGIDPLILKESPNPIT